MFLAVYDATGRIVRVLADEQMEAGNYSSTWNGRDAGGHALASGTYLYQLRANEYSSMRRMVLLK